MLALGLDKELELMDKNKCPTCGKGILCSDFKDELSVKEFKISGMCQTCQDEVFN